MALSNIFREPGKEIAETVVGAAIVVPVLGALVGAGYWIGDLIRPHDMPVVVATLCGTLIAIVAAATGAFLLMLTHWIGEDAIDAYRRRR